MTFTTVNSNGIPFNVRIVRKGERYGLDDCLVHGDDEPLVEFYDGRYNFTPRGQFVSRYYRSTILDRTPGVGLDLHSDIPDWKITGAVMRQVMAWLRLDKELEAALHALEEFERKH